MKYGRDITSVKGEVIFHLPDGSIKKFKDSKSAQDWFNLNYKDDSYEMESYLKQYSDNYKVLNNNKGINILVGKNYSPAYNKALANPLYVKNHNKAILNDPNFVENWDAANNISLFLNAATGGLLNRLSLTLNARLIYDWANGTNINPLKYNSSWWGNSGIVTDKFAQEHPYLTFGINGITDGISVMGLNKGVKYLTKPIIKTGAEAEVITTRISPYVTKKSTIEPSEMFIRNTIPTFLKTRYLGTNSEGLHLYRLPKVLIPKNPKRAFRSISNTLVNNHYFPFKHENMQGRGFLNILNNTVLSDFGETGYGQIGRTFYGKPVMIDMAVESIPEFMINMKKKGGKLNSFNNLFTSYNNVLIDPTLTIPTVTNPTVTNPNINPFIYPSIKQTVKPTDVKSTVLLADVKSTILPTDIKSTILPESIVLPTTLYDDLISIDIEDLLISEGITSVNGKKIKFGNKNLRPANASYGVKNSNHKKKDPHTGFASARDISIIGGTHADYAEFRNMLINNPKVVAWMSAKGWGIINELTPQVLRRTNGTGPHFHFGPDKWGKKIWNTWLNNPNISVTQVI